MAYPSKSVILVQTVRSKWKLYTKSMFNQSHWFYHIEFITVEVQLTLLFDNIHAFRVNGCFPLYASEKFEEKKNCALLQGGLPIHTATVLVNL